MCVLIALVFLASWSLLPTAIEALPSQISARIPEELIAYVVTPLPTALPRPKATLPSQQEEIIIPTLRPKLEPTIKIKEIKIEDSREDIPSPV